MKSTLRLGLALVIGLALVGSALAQSNMPDKAPEKPTGKKRTAADHKEFYSALRTIEFSNPTAGFEGFSTYWPDGYVVSTVKLKDGTLIHNLGTYRVVGDQHCEKNRLPPDSPESCGDGYQLGENMYEFWRADGKFSVFWWYRDEASRVDDPRLYSSRPPSPPPGGRASPYPGARVDWLRAAPGCRRTGSHHHSRASGVATRTAGMPDGLPARSRPDAPPGERASPIATEPRLVAALRRLDRGIAPFLGQIAPILDRLARTVPGRPDPRARATCLRRRSCPSTAVSAALTRRASTAPGPGTRSPVSAREAGARMSPVWNERRGRSVARQPAGLAGGGPDQEIVVEASRAPAPGGRAPR